MSAMHCLTSTAGAPPDDAWQVRSFGVERSSVWSIEQPPDSCSIHGGNWSGGVTSSSKPQLSTLLSGWQTAPAERATSARPRTRTPHEGLRIRSSSPRNSYDPRSIHAERLQLHRHQLEAEEHVVEVDHEVGLAVALDGDR